MQENEVIGAEDNEEYAAEANNSDEELDAEDNENDAAEANNSDEEYDELDLVLSFSPNFILYTI